MSDYLISHALKNVWCSPRQDMQVIYRPMRITSPRGARTNVDVVWNTITLPTPNDVYHVYQIGQYPAMLMGLSPNKGVWRSLAQLMKEQELIADVYTADGLHLTRFNTFVLVMEDQNVLVAVREQKRVVDLKDTPIFLRLYSNAFFGTARSDDFAHEIHCEGARVATLDQALNFQRQYHQYRDRTVGATWLYVNGYYRYDYTPAEYVAGDYVEFVYDSTVKAIKEFSVAELPTFDSIKDAKRKYLLHYPGPQVDGVLIDYRDDIDVYVFKPGNNGRFQGLYYHKNNDDALRQVTHRDYAIGVDYLIGYQQKLPVGTQLSDLKVRLFIREAGYARPLVFEHHRIQELYKLGEEDLTKALLGLESSVHWWRADELENSDYIKIMDANPRLVNIDLVEDAYGYNAISKLVGNTPSKVINSAGRKMVPLPYVLQTNSTVYELDANGKLINSYVHTSGAEYTPFNASCAMVEIIAGRGGNKLDLVFNTPGQTLDPKLSYRFYVAPIVHGVLQNDQWADVTGDVSKYEVVNGQVVWYVDRTYNAVAVKSDATFLNYEITQAADNGVLRFSVNATSITNGVSGSGVLYIPPGRLDLWLNNECLIEGLDYYVKWPQVVITNKRYLLDGQAQKIRIRGTGFVKSDMSRHVPKEVGFVRWGKLSRNNRYDLRDDRVIRLVVGGRTYHRDDIYFTEGDPSLWMDNVANGAPYTLEDLIVPLRKVVPTDTYALRELSMEVDQAISDYLSLKLPENIPQNPDPIAQKYEIYSPFAASVMYDLLGGRLSTEQFRGQYSDQQVREFLKGYEWLLDYEPTRRELDLTHVSIHPHDRTTVIELDAYQYFLLNRAIKVFLEDKVDITRFVRIKDSFI
ncbi:hypothetical protein LUCX_30 [Xanthomonas phage vB_XciM_LucasX]|nr:hypothetical protein LUCX_30 [Xanthomonas phage vB_XciM_LucasX]